jgi:[acyl-carrier-protein] S-malonyltransferase
MAKELYDSRSDVRALYAEANDVLGFDLARVSFEGPESELVQTARTQPAIFVHSMALWTAWGDARPDVAFAAGHSLGEFSALTATGALDFATGLRLVKIRSSAMQKACDLKPGTMAAILNLPDEKLDALLTAVGAAGVVQAANFNSPGQVAISGDRAAVERAVELAPGFGARRSLLLPVGGAFHSPLMEPARAQLAAALDGAEIRAPKAPVVLNVTAKPTSDPEEIRTRLRQQLTAPVLWMQSLETLKGLGVTEFVEIGPGKVLQGLVKRTLGDAGFWGVDTAKDLDKACAAEAGRHA